MEKFKLHIDKVCYKDKETIKNKEEIKKLKYRLQFTSPPVEVSLEEVIEELQKGKTISPAVMKGTKADDFVEQQIFMVDIDNKKKIIPILTVENALEICKKNHLQPVFYYPTFSHTEKIPKYRLVFVMNEVIKDDSVRLIIIKNLISLFEQADTSCRNADRVFFGTDKKAVICDLEARITVDDLLKIPSKSVIVKKKKAANRKNKELEKLINDFDFFNYLKERNGELERETNRYAMFKNCEICGHHNDLVYYPETNSFNCFSDDGDVGGTIIDYLMAVNKLTVTEAIKKFKEELCKVSKKLKVIRMSDVELEEVKWVWYPYIPAGKLTVVYGHPRRWQDTVFTSSWR